MNFVDEKKEKVNHPAHYGGADNPYEAIKVIEAWNLNFNLGNTVKYIARSGKKDELLQELEKARWYLDREIKKLKPEILDEKDVTVKNKFSSDRTGYLEAKEWMESIGHWEHNFGASTIDKANEMWDKLEGYKDEFSNLMQTLGEAYLIDTSESAEMQCAYVNKWLKEKSLFVRPDHTITYLPRLIKPIDGSTDKK